MCVHAHTHTEEKKHAEVLCESRKDRNGPENNGVQIS